MEFGRLQYLFDGDSNILTDSLCELLEKEDPEAAKCREILDSHIAKLQTSNFEGWQDIDDGINSLINANCALYLTVGYIIGQGLEITDPEAMEQINFLKRKLKTIIPFWPKKKAPDRPGKEESGASK